MNKIIAQEVNRLYGGYVVNSSQGQATIQVREDLESDTILFLMEHKKSFIGKPLKYVRIGIRNFIRDWIRARYRDAAKDIPIQAVPEGILDIEEMQPGLARLSDLARKAIKISSTRTISKRELCKELGIGVGSLDDIKQEIINALLP